MKIQQFNYAVNLLDVITWRSDTATRFKKIVELKNTWYFENQESFFIDWFNDVFNLETANDFGLAVWAIILDLPLQIFGEVVRPGRRIFGFKSETILPNEKKNFFKSNFSSFGAPFVLNAEEKRLILRLRYFQLVSKCSIPECNLFFTKLFENYGSVYILDGLNMSIKVVFKFKLDFRLKYILRNYDLIPRAAGVKLYYIDGTRKTFGFGQFKKNFNNGTFIEDFNNGEL